MITHVKDPAVHVRLRWIMETLQHPTCTLGWIARVCRSWLTREKRPQVSMRESQWDDTVVRKKKVIVYFPVCYFKCCWVRGRCEGGGRNYAGAVSRQRHFTELYLSEPDNQAAVLSWTGQVTERCINFLFMQERTERLLVLLFQCLWLRWFYTAKVSILFLCCVR